MKNTIINGIMNKKSILIKVVAVGGAAALLGLGVKAAAKNLVADEVEYGLRDEDEFDLNDISEEETTED